MLATRMRPTRQSEASQRAEQLLKREIAFIHTREFETASDSAMRCLPNLELFQIEAPISGMSKDVASATVLSALQQSRLLTPEAERLLFRKMNYLKFRANALRSSLSVTRPAIRKIAQIETFLAEAEATRNEISRANLRLVASIANKLASSPEEFDELFSEGTSVMLYALDRFDFSRGFRFSTYATHAVQRHLFRVLKRRRRLFSRERAVEDGVLTQTIANTTDVSAQLEQAEQTQLCDRLKQAVISILDDREQFIVQRRLGLDGLASGQTFQEVADQMSLSKERVRQLFERSLTKLRAEIGISLDVA